MSTSRAGGEGVGSTHRLPPLSGGEGKFRPLTISFANQSSSGANDPHQNIPEIISESGLLVRMAARVLHIVPSRRTYRRMRKHVLRVIDPPKKRLVSNSNFRGAGATIVEHQPLQPPFLCSVSAMPEIRLFGFRSAKFEPQTI